MNTPEHSDGPILREHVFDDDIQEYDQKLPNWWLFTLYISIVFFGLYWLAYYQFRAVPSDSERLDPILAELQKQKMDSMLTMLNDENLLLMSKDSSVVAEGKTVYNSVCLACHGPNLGGSSEAAHFIGLSLSDEEWKYGGSPKEIYEMIYNGTPDPAAALGRGEIIMPAQGTLLGAEKTAKVVAYILTYHQS